MSEHFKMAERLEWLSRFGSPSDPISDVVTKDDLKKAAARIRELEAAIAKIARTERRNLTPGHRLTEIYRIAFDVMNPEITA